MTCLEEVFFALQVCGGFWFVKKFSSESVTSKIICYFAGHLLTFGLTIIIAKLLNVRRWFLPEFPPCVNCKCQKKSDYTLIGHGKNGGSLYRCRCGQVYAIFPSYVYKMSPDGEKSLVATKSTGRFFLRWELPEYARGNIHGEKSHELK